MQRVRCLPPFLVAAMQGGGDARNKLCAGGGAREIRLPRQQPVAMELIVR